MIPDNQRFIVLDLPAALSWASERKRQHIRCSLSSLDEYAAKPEAAFNSAKVNIDCLRGIASRQLDAALSVKLTAIGAVFDHDLCMKHLHMITKEAAHLQVPLEIDMEGKDLVEFTIDAARSCRRVHDRITLALQAYLDRTPGDLPKVSAYGMGIRLVKGTYSGDTADFSLIQARFHSLAETLAATGQQFFVGTHDPELVTWLKEYMADRRDQIEFGFLKGFGDQTKQALVSEGWEVSECVPFGKGVAAYIARRKRYCRELEQLDRAPVP